MARHKKSQVEGVAPSLRWIRSDRKFAYLVNLWNSRILLAHHLIAVKVLWQDLWHFVEYLMTLLISYTYFNQKFIRSNMSMLLWTSAVTPNRLCLDRTFFSKFPIAWVTAVDYICPRIMVGRLCRKSPAAWDSTSRKWLARVVTTLSHRGGRRRKTCNLNQQCRSNTTMHRVWSISWKMHTNKCCGSSQLAMVHQNLWAVLTFPQWRAAVGRWKAWQCADS